MVERNGISRSVLRALFTDTVTIYNQISENEWSRTVVEGVQWTEKIEKQNVNGKVNVAKYFSVTFPQGTYESIPFDEKKENECIVLGEVDDVVTDEKGSRVSDLMKKHAKSGLIKSISDNSNRELLKNIKVVLC